MKTISKILKAFKSSEISEKQLNDFLNIKERAKPYLLDLGNNEGFQVYSNNTCLLITEKKEVAERYILNYNETLIKIKKS